MKLPLPSVKKHLLLSPPSLENQFLGLMSLVIICGLSQQLFLGYFHQPLAAGKISTAKRQNLARAMENAERKRHQILTGQGK